MLVDICGGWWSSASGRKAFKLNEDYSGRLATYVEPGYDGAYSSPITWYMHDNIITIIDRGGPSSFYVNIENNKMELKDLETNYKEIFTKK